MSLNKPKYKNIDNNICPEDGRRNYLRNFRNIVLNYATSVYRRHHYNIYVFIIPVTWIILESDYVILNCAPGRHEARGRPGQVPNLMYFKTDNLQTLSAQGSVGEIFFEDECPNFEEILSRVETPVTNTKFCYSFTCGKHGVTSTIFRNILVKS